MPDSLTVVAEQDLHPSRFAAGQDFNASWPARIADGIKGVVQDIKEDLLKLVSVADQFRRLLIEILDNLNPAIGEIIRAQGHSFVQDGVDLERQALRRSLAGKAQQV